MSQDWVADLYTTGTVGDTTLGNMELMFATLKSLFEGASQPANPVRGMPWYDSTKKILKVRDYGNSSWRGALMGSAALKLWLYLNAAEEGWAVDSTVVDRVLAFKGGSQAYNVSGGTNAGTWPISGLGSTGGHALTEAEMPAHDHDVLCASTTTGGTDCLKRNPTGGIGFAYVDFTNDAGGGGSHSHNGSSGDGNWRPSAAVGTLQYPNV